ncbi:MAG TPA: PAS domain S-box protein [Verrucomicrobiae bacterium]|nr:PAS domain S-box protein [Verrucomicrobiae bacterium]
MIPLSANCAPGKAAAWWETSPHLTGWRAYALAGGCLGLALLLRWLLDPLWGDRLPYVLFFFAVCAVAHFADTGPVFLTMVASLGLGDWWFVAPRHSLAIASPADRVNAACFIVISSGVFLLSRKARLALGRERAAHNSVQQHLEALHRLAAIVESSDDAIIGKDLGGVISSWNAAAERLYGYTAAEALGRSIDMLLPADRVNEHIPILERVARGEQIQHFETTRRTRDNRIVEVSLSISPVRDTLGNIVGASTIARDVTERRKTEREREQLVLQLQAALAEVKTLSGLLPICAHCKKIRDDQGYWSQIELYVRQHSNANFTHSICPDCSRTFYPELFPALSTA